MTLNTLFKQNRGLLLVTGAVLLLSACRGEPFQHQPIHPIQNMDQQRRFEAQEENDFFADNRAMRQPVDGTVARGELKNNSVVYDGRNEDGEFVDEIPFELSTSFIRKGQKEYEIYCTPCHGGTGDGEGIIMTGGYGYVPAPSYHIDRLRNVTDGYMYDLIKNGIRNMPAYGHQIDPKDRWAIVAYVRALQISQNADPELLEKFGTNPDEVIAQKEQQQQESESDQQASQQEESGGGEVSAARGKKLFTANACQTCHSTDGTTMTGPSLQGIFQKEVSLQSGETVVADEEYLRKSIVESNSQVVEGYQPIMPNYSSLSDAEVQSLVEYLKTL